MKFVKKRFLGLLAAVCAAALCLSLTACGGEATATTEEEDASVAEEDMIYAEAGGSITLPEGVAMPEENNAFVSQLNGDTLAGAFKNATSNYKTTGYFTTGGSITVTVSGELFTDGIDTQWKDATFSLWKQGENTTQYVSTVHWTADGTTQTYTFTGLEPGVPYRVAFTYSDVYQYKLSATFNITGIVAETESEDLELNEE